MGCDLMGCDLMGCDLMGCDLMGLIGEYWNGMWCGWIREDEVVFLYDEVTDRLTDWLTLYT